MDPWGSEVRQSSVAGESRPVREPVSMRWTAFLKMMLKGDTQTRQGVVMPNFNPSTREVGKGRESQDQPGLYDEFQASQGYTVRSHLKN